jgi:hypothetical protein
MAAYRRKQGNSLWIDITCDISEIDKVWANWSGSWKISAALGSVALLSGTLEKSTTPGLFHLKIGPVSGGVAWAGLAPETYVLATEILNATADYSQEDHDSLTILQQGI